MTLDVYVGPLTRYYAGTWKNPAKRAGSERGRSCEALRSAVLDWRTSLGASLGSKIRAPLDWDETPAAPHFTIRPGWGGFGSLVLWAAYAEHPALARPERVPEAWEDDPALARCSAEGFRSRYVHLARDVELWLPAPLDSTFRAVDVSGRKIVMGSVPTLRRQLADLNGATWRASHATVEGWRRRPPPDRASLEARARYGFATMLEAARRATNGALPMKLDY